MQKAHDNIDWENYPSIITPINEQNLNKMDRSIDTIDDRVISLDTTKFNVSDAQTLIKNVTFNLQTGVLTKYYYNGSTEEINTGLSKLNMNLRFDNTSQILYIINADGTEDPIDLSTFITNYEFSDSDTITHNVSSDGRVTSIVKEGSIEEKHLQPNYLADIRVEVSKAQASATSAATSANNAKVSETNAKTSETNAKASETVSAQSASTASQKATEATNSEAAAAQSAVNTKTSETNAKTSETNAKTSETNAKASETASAQSASEAGTSAGLSQSYAVGTNGVVRPNDVNDNAKAYSQEAKKQAELAESYAKVTSPAFIIANNRLYIKTGTGVNFIVQNNRLYWCVE